MLKIFKILKTILLSIIPYIFLYAIYIQLNGKVSPGGGFQAGVIFTTGLIAYDFVLKSNELQKYFSVNALTICSVFCVGLYATTALISFINNDNYLNYNSIVRNDIAGQHVGVFLIELGIGVTVTSVMCLIYLLLRED